MNKQVLVLGMHRSGTSLTASFLRSGGFFLNETVAGDQYNQRGYSEDRDVVALNEGLLRVHGGTWNWPVRLPPVSRDPLTAQHVKSVVHAYDRHAQWVMKDPRLCVTLPYWLPHVNTPLAVICIRNPLAVAQSLFDRDGIPLQRGMKLWSIYTTLSIVQTTTIPRIVVPYEAYFTDERKRIFDMLEGFVGAKITGADAAIDQSLQHQSGNTVEFFADVRVPNAYKELYRTVLSASEHPSILETIEDLERDLSSPMQVQLACAVEQYLRRHPKLEEKTSRVVRYLQRRGIYPVNGVKGTRW